MAKKKIAVLGGGVGALSALLRLTEDEADRETFDITVYQMGWRLGGKCASGRDVSNPTGARIYEHGLHVFAGFYYHAFGMLKGCYDELGGSGGVVATNVYDAFRRKNDIVLLERVNGQQVRWPMTFLELPKLPHEEPAVPTVAQIVEALLSALSGFFIRGDGHPGDLPERASLSSIGNLPEPLAARVNDAMGVLDDATVDGFVDRSSLDLALEQPGSPDAIHQAVLVARASAQSPGPSDKSYLRDVVDLLALFETQVRDTYEPQIPDVSDVSELAFSLRGLSDWLRRILLGTDLAKAVVSGIHGDDVIANGFDPLDQSELKDWLRHWGAREETINWAPVDAGYDYAFAYDEGDEARPGLGAGTGLRGFLRLLFAYKGSLFWEMLGGMGEVVILPMYLVLKQRGVKFEFFHQVTNLGLGNDKTRVESITITRQAEVKTPPYEPLIDIGELKAWPVHPNWDQLVNGDELNDLGIDFEWPWSEVPNTVDLHLQIGQDFDEVILGISIAEVARITPELKAASQKWARMVTEIKTSRTIALQLWMKPTVAQGGFQHPDRISTRTRQPLSTWSDMTFLINCEKWPDGNRPGSLHYFCGQVPSASLPSDLNDLANARARCRSWLKSNSSLVMPNRARPQQPFGFDPDDLFVNDGSIGGARFDWQHCRINLSPSELYVQSAPQTLEARLGAHDSGFTNLYLAGDWTRNGLNAGCVEAAVMSGIQCANALRGVSNAIPGELDVDV